MAEGIRFDSKKEAGRFRELQAMLQAGLIRELRLQQDFTLQEAYTTPDGRRIRAIRTARTSVMSGRRRPAGRRSSRT